MRQALEYVRDVVTIWAALFLPLFGVGVALELIR